MELITIYDCMGANLPNLTIPPGVKMAGYTTGSGDVPWSSAQFMAHPDAIRIDQSPINTVIDETADVYDLENQAGTLEDMPTWVHGAWNSYTTARRPGQRPPAVYCSRSNVTPVANKLLSAGITHGVGLWIAAEANAADAAAEVSGAGGPFPVIGRQYLFFRDYDVSVVSGAWWRNVSQAKPAHPPGPGTQSGFLFCHKCKCLFYGPQAADSACAKGGIHDGSQSHNYSIAFVV